MEQTIAKRSVQRTIGFCQRILETSDIDLTRVTITQTRIHDRKDQFWGLSKMDGTIPREGDRLLCRKAKCDE